MNEPSKESLQTWQRIAFTYKIQRDSTGRMLADTTAAYHTYKAEQPGKLAKAEKKARNTGFLQGFKWGGITVTTLLGILAILTK